MSTIVKTLTCACSDTNLVLSRVQGLNLSLGALVLPDVNF